MLAERLHLSGILTMVVFAMATVAARRRDVIPARIRIPSYAVWEVAVFVLNVLAFILVGFQLKSHRRALDRETLARVRGGCGAPCASRRSSRASPG